MVPHLRRDGNNKYEMALAARLCNRAHRQLESPNSGAAFHIPFLLPLLTPLCPLPCCALQNELGVSALCWFSSLFSHLGLCFNVQDLVGDPWTRPNEGNGKDKSLGQGTRGRANVSVN